MMFSPGRGSDHYVRIDRCTHAHIQYMHRRTVGRRTCTCDLSVFHAFFHIHLYSSVAALLRPSAAGAGQHPVMASSGIGGQRPPRNKQYSIVSRACCLAVRSIATASYRLLCAVILRSSGLVMFCSKSIVPPVSWYRCAQYCSATRGLVTFCSKSIVPPVSWYRCEQYCSATCAVCSYL